MIYSQKSKAIDIRELLDHYGDQDFGINESTDSEADNNDSSNNAAFFSAIDELEFDSSVKDENADFMAKDDDYDTQIPAIAAEILTYITTISLAKFRRDGPFGKLHAFGVLLRKSTQLKQAFIAAQLAVNPGQQSLAWVHNMATRWFSDFAMAEKAL
jgi:hypothetical protein